LKTTVSLEHSKNQLMNMDFLIIGGGLAGSLLLSALKHFHPKLKVLLLEQNSSLGGNHTWCLHDADIPSGANSWFQPLLSRTWAEYHVYFPEHDRRLKSAYHSIQSTDLSKKILGQWSSSIRLNCKVTQTTRDAESGLWKVSAECDQTVFEYSATTVIRCSGWKKNSTHQRLGYQKFVGLDVELTEPHCLDHVVLMDARVPQVDGYRFMYLLPWSETSLLVEDTYYSNHPNLKVERIQKEIQNYLDLRGWKIKTIHRSEEGCLPLDLDPSKESESSEIPPCLGAESNFLNPVTGYTLPYTLRAIDQLMHQGNLTDESCRRTLRELRQAESSKLSYLNFLNRMMFLAARNENRYKILQRFYLMPEGTIQRFYTGSLNWWDRIRILVGKPPVSVISALKVLKSRKNVTHLDPS